MTQTVEARREELREEARLLAGRSTLEVLQWAAERYRPLAFLTGFGPEGCVIVDHIGRHRLPVEVLTLDTGLLFPETRALWAQLEQRYRIRIRAVKPPLTLEEQAAQLGDRLWEREPDRCCRIRKVEPLRAALRGYAGWLTGIRRDQTRERAAAEVVEWDEAFGLVKVNPLVSWTSAEVWAWLREHRVPVNVLHEQGYPSIGCIPCTTPVAAGEDPRAGRWRGREKTECGLHSRPRPELPTLRTGKDDSTRVAKEKRAMSALVEPHGGELVDRFVHGADAEALRARAASLPRLTLDARERADLELIATGAASPLTGFLTAEDYAAVVERLRLADGTVWPLPLTLAVDDDARRHVTPGAEAALVDANGRLWGTIEVRQLFDRDPLAEARHVYGTEDPKHPGVAYLLSRPGWLVGGPVHVLPLPEDLPFASHRLTPRRLREEIRSRGWRRVAGFQTRNPIHRAHEHLTKLALELSDGLVLHPLVGETKEDDVPAGVRFRAYETLLDRYYPRDRTLLAAFPAAMRYAGPREALFHAIVRKNYGITHLIVGRDHAGVGSYYGPYDAQAIFDRFDPAELGVTPLKLEPAFYCRACGALASRRTCPHDEGSRLELSGSRVREVLRSGGHLPAEFTRPEVAEILREHYAEATSGAAGNGHGHVRANGSGHGHTTANGNSRAEAPQASALPRPAPGFIVWFTGLSGAGKSTLAAALRERLGAQRAVEVLDGDEVRTHLSKGLGFSKEDRDTNIARIGYVARLLARNGAVAITAAISPYAAARDEVRRLAERDGVPFVEVFAQAELEALVARDVKGLYRKALAGEVAHFTGVSDPYEAPSSPDVLVRTDSESVDDSLGRILAALLGRGLLGQAAGQAVAS